MDITYGVAIKENGTWRELPRDRSFMVGDTGYPWITVELWPEEDLAVKLKIKPITVDPIPEGKIATGSTLVDDNGKPRRVWTLEDAPPPEPEPVPVSATKLGLKRALDEIGRWQEVKTMIDADPDIAEDWQLAIEIRRDDPMFAAFVASGQFNEAEIDHVFRRAVEIVA